MRKMINVTNISKTYRVKEVKTTKSYFTSIFNKSALKDVHAIDDISFSIDKGETVGFIGNNGAGKSTTIKMLTGILYPTKGSIEVFGKNPFKHRIENNYKIAAVFGQRCQLRWDISPFESYKLLRSIYKINKSDFNERLEKFIDILSLKDFLYKPVRTLSLGQKMRAELSAAFLHDPEIVYLDEPTIGLDIFSKDAILNFIKEENQNKDKLIMLTTHDLADIKEVCGRIMIIDQGKLLYDMKMEELKNFVSITNDIEVITEEKPPFIPVSITRFVHKTDGHKITFLAVKEEDVALIVNQIVKCNKIINIKIESGDFKKSIKALYNLSDKGVR